MKFLKLILVATSIVLSSNTSAAIIEMTEGELFDPSYLIGSMGTGRGIGITANDDFHMSSLGIDLGVSGAGSALFQYEIYSSIDGSSADSLLADVSFSLIDGEGWRDISFDFDFFAGASYVINFSRVDDSKLFGVGTYYSIEPSGFVDYGPFALVQGFEGATPNPTNPLVPYMRMDAVVVPVPAAAWLFASGLIGLLGFTRRKKV